MMFGTILTSGMQTIANCGFSQRNITIVAMALSIGIGFTTTSESGIWAGFSPVVQSVFSANVVAVVSVVAIIMNPILLKDTEVQKLDNYENTKERDKGPEPECGSDLFFRLTTHL